MTTNTDRDLLKLAPCPFCGGTNIKALAHLDWVACDNCGASLEDCEPSARELWNTRHSASAGRGEVVAWRWKNKAEDQYWQHCSSRYTPPKGSVAEPLYATPPAAETAGREPTSAFKVMADHFGLSTPADTSASVVGAAVMALAFDTESDVIDNLEGALIDIKRLSEQGKPTDAVCIRTLERIQSQLVAAQAALTSQGKADAGSDPFVAAAIAEDAKWPDPILGAAQRPTEWQPGETAPKDGTIVFVAGRSSNGTWFAADAKWDGNYWCLFHPDRDEPTFAPIELWMPIPSLPSAQSRTVAHEDCLNCHCAPDERCKP
jgi:hypothetical protein